ncbi:Hypothetical protein SMAX5B_021106 [Scophthalmus maximus]|uniref:Uncharacterized protein n=1 Tax=Scophthalmus maximus TaxID=52904 RepID=A0A2U9CCI7_SCOMX|nr:Hypothetical protein SMAX5B_021106 [Scophthalmus maximus]
MNGGKERCKNARRRAVASVFTVRHYLASNVKTASRPWPRRRKSLFDKVVQKEEAETELERCTKEDPLQPPHGIVIEGVQVLKTIHGDRTQENNTECAV